MVFLQHCEDPQRRELAQALRKRAIELGQQLTVVLPQPSEAGAWYCLEPAAAGAFHVRAIEFAS